MIYFLIAIVAVLINVAAVLYLTHVYNKNLELMARMVTKLIKIGNTDRALQFLSHYDR